MNTRNRLSLGCACALAAFVAQAAGASDVEKNVPVDAVQNVVAPAPDALARMQDFVARRIDPRSVRATLVDAGGGYVDCVDVEAQPGLVDAGGVRQPLERTPRTAPPVMRDFAPIAAPLQRLDGAGTAGCPDGSVPIAAVGLDELRAFRSLDDYFRKEPADVRAPGDALVTVDLTSHTGPTAQHQYAHAARSEFNYGAAATINVWQPFTELHSEFSLGQIWVSGGVKGGTGGQLPRRNGLQTLEVGVQVYKDLYGDTLPHLFIYSTRDNYKNGTNDVPGCYNNSCLDFVQVSNITFPKMTLTPSSVDGAQREIRVQWFKDGDAGHWWLNVNGEWIGYYPRSLFRVQGVANYADRIDFGGEIIDNRNANLHTSTDMGSGRFSWEGFARAAYMRNLEYRPTVSGGGTTSTQAVPGLTASNDDPMCYDISGLVTGDANWGSYFFYGGKGYDFTNCR